MTLMRNEVSGVSNQSQDFEILLNKEIKMDFEAEMKKLADIAAKMEKGDLPLEESMKLYTEAVELTHQLRGYIEEAKKKVEALEGQQ